MGKILVSWVGNKDLEGAADGYAGPLEQIINAYTFDAIYLIHNHSPKKTKLLVDALNDKYPARIVVTPVNLASPIHFGDIYSAIDGVLASATGPHPGQELYIQLTSGTPAMTAVSILVGKTKYSAAHFIQSSKEQGVQEETIPFDIAADFLPALVEQNDNHISSLINGDAPVTAAFDDIVTRDPQMEKLKQMAAVLALRDLPVLIYGESGTGKELFARAIVNASLRKDKPFKTLNCGAIPEELIEATLFGHTKGAFTGANEARKGYFEQADGGTLFLDEFGDLPLSQQVHLLRVLQDGTFTPVGSTKELKVNVRIIAATNKNLVEEVAEGRFREDLFYRVAIGVLHLPPLRERKGDLVVLAEALLENINKEAQGQPGYKDKKLSVKAKNLIKQCPWPGNVRELNATLLRASLWDSSNTLSDSSLKQAIFQNPKQQQNLLNRDVSQGVDIQGIIAEISTHYITQALEQTNNSKTKAAELLGLKNYQTLNNWMEKYNIN